MGIEPTSPEINPGILSQLNNGGDQMDKWRRRYGASQAGLEPTILELQCLRTATSGSLTVSNQPLSFGAITCELRPIRIGIGQEAGIRTRTVSFTGRDAADYTTILMGPLVGLAPSVSTRPQYKFTKLVL